MRAPVSCLATGVMASILAIAHPTGVRADDERSAATRCIYVDRIDQTRIVDGRSILFFMRNRTVLQNVLPNACPSLRARDGIRYEVTLGQLCAGEFVTQLVDAVGSRPGALCKIGMFVPIGEEEARSLLPTRKVERDRVSSEHAIEVKPVEPPPAAAATASPRTGDRVEPARAAEPESR
jgi:hypothetical protein